MKDHLLTRRQAVGRWLAATSLGIAGAELWPADPAQAQLLPETPSCGPDSAPTISQTEGPYYTPHTPAKRDFRADAPGEAITLTGFVIDRRCQPVADAVVDLWHADARGAYDNSGFRLRGYQITDPRGRYVFETIVPGIYPGLPGISTSRLPCRAGAFSPRNSTFRTMRAPTAATASSTAAC